MAQWNRAYLVSYLQRMAKRIRDRNNAEPVEE